MRRTHPCSGTALVALAALARADPAADAAYCASLNTGAQRAFCRQELPGAHAAAVAHMEAALEACEWRSRGISGTTAPSALWGTPPNAYRGPPYYLWTMANLTWADGAPVGQTVGVPGLEVQWRAAELRTPRGGLGVQPLAHAR